MGLTDHEIGSGPAGLGGPGGRVLGLATDWVGKDDDRPGFPRGPGESLGATYSSLHAAGETRDPYSPIQRRSAMSRTIRSSSSTSSSVL